MIAVEHVSKRYGDESVLHDVSLTVPSGTTLSLIGPSGCGKSTLLRIVMGLVTADTGNVTLDGVAMKPSNCLQLRRRMGYVIQSGGLFPHLSARNNLTLVTDYLGWDRQQTSQRIQELCDLTGIDAELLERRPQRLSGGQAQRISLMRALMLEPDILLMDEPLGSIDPLVRADLQADLRTIFRKLGKTVLLVTHDLGEAVFLGDTIALMRDGQLVQQGTARELVHQPASAFVERFVHAQRSPLQDL